MRFFLLCSAVLFFAGFFALNRTIDGLGRCEDNLLAVVIYQQVQSGTLSYLNYYDVTDPSVYLLSTADFRLREFAPGNHIRWSPSGRYLAALNEAQAGVMDGGRGRIIGISVQDMEQPNRVAHEVSAGSGVEWSPNETYLLVGGFVSRSGGAVNWFDVLSADGTGELGALRIESPYWMHGFREAVSIISWLSQREVLIEVKNLATEAKTYYRFNFDTQEYLRTDAPPAAILPTATSTPLVVLSPTPDLKSHYVPTAAAAEDKITLTASDGCWHAKVTETSANALADYLPDAQQFVVYDSLRGQTYSIDLPPDTLRITDLQWQP